MVRGTSTRPSWSTWTVSDPYSTPPSGDPQNPYGAPPTQPYGQQPYPQQPYPQQPYAQQPYAQPGAGHPAYGEPAGSDRRPGGVTFACVTAIALSALALLAGLLLVIIGAAGSDTFTDSFRDSSSAYDDLTDQDINNIVLGIGAVMLVWSVAAIVIAIFALRRSNVARVLLTVSAAMTVLVSLIGILSIVAVVPLAGAIAVIVMLYVGGANGWYARRNATPAGSLPPQGW